LAAAGILYALAASLLFIPAMLAVLPVPHPIIRKNPNKRYILERILLIISHFEAHHPRKILWVSIVATLFVASGIFFLRVDSNLVNYYPKGHDVRESAHIVNEKFGGAQIISIKVKGDILSPELLKKIDSIEQEIAQLPYVGNTISLAQLVKVMTTGFMKKDTPGYNKIPSEKKVVEWYITQYSKMGDAEELRTLVNSSFSAAQITIQITSTSSELLRGVVKQVRDILKDDPRFSTMTGSAVVFSSLIDKVVWGQIASLILSLLVVSLLVALLFRSFIAGLIALVPLSMSMLLLFGIMGYTGISLDIVTAMLSSIVIGVGVDYTIHFLWKYKEELAKTGLHHKAVDETLHTVGRGIIFNAFSVMIGFIVLFFSNFLPIRFFGFLIILSIGMSLIGAMIILPALVVVFRPKFLEPKSHK
jgi:predicted RND superfamily exporter protein